MKKTYQAVECTIVSFKQVDVIRTSGNGFTGADHEFERPTTFDDSFSS